MRPFAVPAIAALAAVCLLTPVQTGAAEQSAPARPSLAGAWKIDRARSTPPGILAMPDDETGEPVGGRRGGGGFGGFGGGRRGGMGGGGGMGGPGGGMRPRDGDMATRRALLAELMALPPAFTIAQDGDKVVFIEPDGVVRSYVANGRTEKHQLHNGTIETKTRWDGDALEMELEPSSGLRITRRYAVHGTPRQLEITTTTNRGPKNAKRVTVYDVTDDPPQAP